uniref:AlNc14C345G10849 protein n=1 Tax=Albugo laibachii Nc14 TaxID=890382 RepID=F0WX94_9STRA|nr:AlNc14C345G10849 [Albugo laibachii Nc14]|eukprot:CCA26086.1 AlNc14C345G10849 [Albugo laibachii Nc14]
MKIQLRYRVEEVRLLECEFSTLYSDIRIRVTCLSCYLTISGNASQKVPNRI